MISDKVRRDSHVMKVGPRVLVLVTLHLPIGYADTHTPPWPREPGTTKSVPTGSVPVKSWPSAAPQAVAPLPGMSPMMEAPPRIAEFAKLREAVEKKGTAAKAAGGAMLPARRCANTSRPTPLLSRDGPISA